MTSLRRRMIVGTIAGSMAVLLVAGGGLYATLRRLLQDDFNATLAAKAKSIAALVEEDEGKVELEIDYRTMREFESGPRCEYFQLSRPDGTALYRSRSLGSGRLDILPSKDPIEQFGSVLLPDGRRGRLVSLVFTPRQGSEDEAHDPRKAQSGTVLTLGLARETRLLDHTLTRLALLLVAVGAGAMLVCAVVLSLVVRRGLRPLDDLAGQIHAIGEDLSAQVNLPGAPSELRPVIERLNEMLRRLEAAFIRERRFSADIAHDLRTPLAGLRSTLEVAISRERGTEEYRQAIHDSLEIAGQMQSVTNTLLALTRAESGQLSLERQRVDVPALVRTAWEPFAEKAASRGIKLHWEPVPDCQATTDPGQLSLVVGNLFGNAATYANAGGDIFIEVISRGDCVCIKVRNTGCQLTADAAAHVFDRLWRGDKSRMGTELHCGLGLSLARRITELLNGTIDAQVENGVFSIHLCIPANDTTPVTPEP